MTAIATLETILTADDSGLRAGLKGASSLLDATVGKMGSSIQTMGRTITGLGTSLTAAMAPLAAGLGLAVKGAVDFDSAMTNVGAVLGQNAGQMKDLREEILDIGTASRFGPQAAAEAFYDIAGGVLDASSRIEVLNTAILTAEAGSASLQGTTSALISVMNAFGTSGLKAAEAGDILTVAVNKGVGTMDELAAAIPGAAALAANAGISFQELASAMAFSTTSGFSFSEAATQMQSVMRAFLNPNKDMNGALKAMGYTSGSAALKALGLAGAVKALKTAVGGSTDAMAQALGRTEALQGAMALTKDGFADFNQGFIDMTAGATDAAAAIQNMSAQASLDFLKSQLQGLGITIGDALLPRINELVTKIEPVITAISTWVYQNPELTGTILEVVAALSVLGPVLIVVGQAITAIGSIITLVTSGPFLLLIAAFAALKLAYDNNFLGFKDTVDGIISHLSILAGAVPVYLNTIKLYFDTILGNIWAVVGPGLTQVYNWFTQTALPAVVNFVQNTVFPAINDFVSFLGKIWETIQPGLENLRKWFVDDALPAVIDFVNNQVMPGLQIFGEFLETIWDLVGPALTSLANWFITDALPQIVNFINVTVMPVLKTIGGFLANLWDQVKPGLEPLFTWFRDTFTQIEGFIDRVIKKLSDLKGALGAWQGISNNAATIGAGLSSGQFSLGQAIDAFAKAAAAEPLFTLPGGGTRDSGGSGVAGRAYVINPKAGPEVFVPSTNGTFYPNADQMLGGGMSLNWSGDLVLGDTGHRSDEDILQLVKQGLVQGLRAIAQQGGVSNRRGGR